MNQDEDYRRNEQQAGDDALAAAGDQIKADASTLVEKAKHDAAEIGAEIQADLGTLTEEGKRQAEDVVAKAKGYANEQKDLLVEQIGSVAKAIRKVADELEQDNATTAGYARQLAGGMDRLSSTMKTRDIDSILAMAEDFGRKQPAAFMAVAALAGFAGSRFLRASAEHRSETSRSSSSTEQQREGRSPTYFGSTATPDNESSEMGRPYR